MVNLLFTSGEVTSFRRGCISVRDIDDLLGDLVIQYCAYLIWLDEYGAIMIEVQTLLPLYS